MVRQTLQPNKKAIEFLIKNPDKKFTVRQIAEWILKTYPTQCEIKKKKSTKEYSDKEFVSQISAEIRGRQIAYENKKIEIINKNPFELYYTEKNNWQTINQFEIKTEPMFRRKLKTVNNNKAKLLEKDLYPLLIGFLKSEFELHSMRINEKHANNIQGTGANRWLYPDVVALEDLSAAWHREIKQCVKQSANKKTRLWSFEVKIKINRSNVREVFFQTVSNSTWAHFGYLVASDIDIKARRELQILSNLHGIGFIQLNIKSPINSQVIIPAQERNDVDWHLANRIATVNKDFLKFIKNVREFYQTGSVRGF